MANALIIVDVQNDFCEGGALPVTGGAQVAREITKYVNAYGITYDLVSVSQDWHDADNDNGGHFSDTPDYVNTWPRHCVADTEGARLHPWLNLDSVGDRTIGFRKGQGKPAYSVWEGASVATGTQLKYLLSAYDITHIDVCGLAFDYCVAATAHDVNDKYWHETVGHPHVRVLSNLTAGVSRHTELLAAAELGYLGKEILGFNRIEIVETPTLAG